MRLRYQHSFEFVAILAVGSLISSVSSQTASDTSNYSTGANKWELCEDCREYLSIGETCIAAAILEGKGNITSVTAENLLCLCSASKFSTALSGCSTTCNQQTLWTFDQFLKLCHSVTLTSTKPSITATITPDSVSSSVLPSTSTSTLSSSTAIGSLMITQSPSIIQGDINSTHSISSTISNNNGSLSLTDLQSPSSQLSNSSLTVILSVLITFVVLLCSLIIICCRHRIRPKKPATGFTGLTSSASEGWDRTSSMLESLQVASTIRKKRFSNKISAPNTIPMNQLPPIVQPIRRGSIYQMDHIPALMPQIATITTIPEVSSSEEVSIPQLAASPKNTPPFNPFTVPLSPPPRYPTSTLTSATPSPAVMPRQPTRPVSASSEASIMTFGRGYARALRDTERISIDAASTSSSTHYVYADSCSSSRISKVTLE